MDTTVPQPPQVTSPGPSAPVPAAALARTSPATAAFPTRRITDLLKFVDNTTVRYRRFVDSYFTLKIANAQMLTGADPDSDTESFRNFLESQDRTGALDTLKRAGHFGHSGPLSDAIHKANTNFQRSLGSLTTEQIAEAFKTVEKYRHTSKDDIVENLLKLERTAETMHKFIDSLRDVGWVPTSNRLLLFLKTDSVVNPTTTKGFINTVESGANPENVTIAMIDAYFGYITKKFAKIIMG